MRKDRFYSLLFLLLLSLPVAACAADPEPCAPGTCAPYIPKAWNELTKPEQKYVLEAHEKNKRLKRLFIELLFGKKNEITLWTSVPIGKSIYRYFLNGNCQDLAPQLYFNSLFIGASDSGGYTRFVCRENGRQRYIPDLLVYDHRAWLWERYGKQKVAGKNPIPPREPDDASVYHQQHIIKQGRKDIVESAMAHGRSLDLKSYDLGYFSNNDICKLMIKRDSDQATARFLSIYIYPDGRYEGISDEKIMRSLTADQDFLECAYRSRFVAMGLQGGATMEANAFMHFKGVENSVRGKGGSPMGLNYAEPSMPVAIGLFNTLLREGILKKGHIERSDIPDIFDLPNLKYPQLRDAHASGMRAFPRPIDPNAPPSPAPEVTPIIRTSD
ncbi:MAG: hypothetical protein V7679_08715 [Parasphingorhabdus sp.]